MNYYNPYLYTSAASSPGLLKSLFGSGASFGTFLSNAQKVISTINQTIPAIKQITPIVKNAKTMFSVMNEFKKVDNPVINKVNNNNNTNQNTISSRSNIIIDNTINDTNSMNYTNTNGPNFFI